ncbi:nitrilase-related carbon-nitrogen hydrolase [Aquimarina hainanensis]|uniref:Nitrilase-related carbon-nitrogen hydrolase n=1 Tax=Aquimarina hainanensis TaxID=1578017 RepID=A0ABW5NC82_9FLAO|nr:nitrilase-related carbon-nitrogen hydrolase [Aquimarina sp. TRL1]QKX06668.1 hypothetical protein HN014_17685 [Aquimarina sp. TRL1]
MKKEHRFKLIFLSLLVLISLFANGRFALFFAPWISTTMLLFASRRFSPVRSFLFSWLFLTATFSFQFYNVFPIPLHFHIISMAIPALFSALPFLVDILFSNHRNKFIHTLIFPIASVVISYVYHKYYPYGSWGHIAYTQESQSILIQSIAVFGLSYITFLIGWFASICNWIYLQHFNSKAIKKSILTFGIVFMITTLFGSYRILFQKADSDTVRIASISLLKEYAIYDNDLFGLAIEGGKEKFKKQSSALLSNLFERSIQEAKAGAKIVFWSEGNGLVLKEDELSLYVTASEIAKKQDIYLGIAIGVIDQHESKPYENKFVLFTPNGHKAIDYWKGIPVPGFEASISNNKQVGIQKTETPYGTIGAAICFDMDFPHFLKQAKGSDILLAPSNDWKAIDPIHTKMAKFRAIEQGFNLIRQTSNGLSAGFDYTGKTISEMDYFQDKGKILITQLPTKGVTTIYSVIGDLFIVGCLTSFILISIVFKTQSPEKE